MNSFVAVMDTFYELKQEYLAQDNYSAALAMDTVIDLFDNLMKGVPWKAGMANFTRAVSSVIELEDDVQARHAYTEALSFLR